LVISSSDLSRESSSIVNWWPLEDGKGSGLLSSDVGSSNYKYKISKYINI
jgi:hypothetical protein